MAIPSDNLLRISFKISTIGFASNSNQLVTLPVKLTITAPSIGNPANTGSAASTSTGSLQGRTVNVN